MRFWLSLVGSIIVLIITPALARFSGAYNAVAKKVGALLPPCSWFTISLTLIIASCIAISYAIYYYKASKKCFKSFLMPVQGKGYCIDKRFKEPVCPKCATDNAETFMRFIPSQNQNGTDILYCNVCGCVVDLCTCSAQTTKV